MTRILIAPDSFKETLTAIQAAQAIARGIHATLPDAQLDLCPMADGGEGTVETLIAATGGQRFTHRVTGPLGSTVDATWGMLGNVDSPTAVIESASAAGLHLVPADQRDPTHTTTFGIGQLIRHALDHNAKTIILGLGGSATNDGGTGMAQALGVKFSLRPSVPSSLHPFMSGGLLEHIESIDLSARVPLPAVRAACDVTNPLTGPTGAAAIFAPQKGATPAQVAQLDRGLAHLASLLNVDPQLPGCGAAGGLGFGLLAFANATLEPGFDIIADAVKFDDRLKHADLVISGEGKLDSQSIAGKTCIGVARRASKFGVPTIALVGIADDSAKICLRHGLTAYHAICNDTTPPHEAMKHPALYLEQLAQRIIADYLR